MNRLIVGVGTGRCGTKSLARLLARQRSTTATHERYESKVRWGAPKTLWARRLWRDTLRSGSDAAADVAFYWTPQLPALLEWAGRTGRDVRVVGLKRPRAETARSYQRWTDADHWRPHSASEADPSEWDHCYPAYDAPTQAEAIGAFWDDVYERELAHAGGKARGGEWVALNPTYAAKMERRGYVQGTVPAVDARPFPLPAQEEISGVPLGVCLSVDTTCLHDRVQPGAYNARRDRDWEVAKQQKMGVAQEDFRQWSRYPHGEPDWQQPDLLPDQKL